MLKLIARRIIVAILIFIVVSIITFTLLRASGDPAAALAGQNATARDIEYIRKYYGFDRPLIVQYFGWAKKAITGDFGRSIYLQTQVTDVIRRYAPVTLKLGMLALGFAIIVAIPLGILSATHVNSLVDRISLTFAVIGQGAPSFWYGLLLIIFFGVRLKILPISGSDTWLHYILPTVTLGYTAVPSIMRLTRSGMLDVLSSDYIRTARAKGLKPPSVILKHALRNAAIPVVSVSAVQLGRMLSGSILIEIVFTLNGLGRLAWASISRSDFEVMQAIVLIMAVFYIIANLLADILNALLDPRIRI